MLLVSIINNVLEYLTVPELILNSFLKEISCFDIIIITALNLNFYLSTNENYVIIRFILIKGDN
jgi:hypothetical protein